jgi:ferritin-like metal-binding protein YciE
MTIDTPHKLLIDQLQDILSFEQQLEDALPELVEMAASREIAELLADHLAQTREHRSRVERILERLGASEGDSPCKAMQGLIEGGSNHLKMTEGADLRDLLLVAHCTRIEAYEIAAYNFAISIADRLGLHEESELLRDSRKDEQHVSDELSYLSPLEVVEEKGGSILED